MATFGAKIHGRSNLPELARKPDKMESTTLNALTLKAQLQAHLQDDLKDINQILQEQLASSSRFVRDVTEHVSRYRGKQVRPILLLLVQRMLSGDVTPEARTLAAAVELIHTATLVHDDVIDQSETRRHVATVHRRWNTETSVLLGDFLFSRSFHLAATTGDADACRLIGRATDRTCEGELNQIAARLEQSTSEFDYFRIIRDKTGQLFGLSCLLGARAAGAGDRQQRAARRFGMRLGTAFQIADDVLDLTQPAEKTGKDAANDLQNGRLTLPLLRALRIADNPAERDTLRQMITGGDELPTETSRPAELILAGTRSAARTAEKIVARAIGDLKHFPENHDQRLLGSIARFAVRRED